MNSLNQNICRTCKVETSNSENFINIFKKCNEFPKAPRSIINKFLSLDFRITDYDDLPKEICRRCLHKFLSFNEFIENCQKIQLELKSTYQVIREIYDLEYDVKEEDQSDYETIEYDESEIFKNEERNIIEKEPCTEDIKPLNFNLKFKKSKKHSNSRNKKHQHLNDFENLELEIVKEVYIEIEKAPKLLEETQCRYCTDETKIFRSKKQLLYHITTNHPEVVQTSKSTEVTMCDICGLEMRQFKLRNHIQVVHEGKIPYKCEYCDDAFPYKINLTNHIKLSHKEQYLLEQQNKNKQIFECEYCRQIFKNLLALKGHINKMHDPDHPRNLNPRNKPYPCTECDRIYNRKDHLKTHIKKIHWKVMPFKCEKCKKPFSEQYELNQHLRKTHKEFESLECDVCGKLFRGGYANLSYMKRHIKEQHSEAPQYNCLLCDEKFFKKSELNKHGKEHIEIPYKLEEYYTSIEYLN